MRSQIEYVFLIILLELLSDSSEDGYCSFPDFLWAAMPDGNERKWLSKTEYVRNTVAWERQKEITVHKTEMIIKHKVNSPCDTKYNHFGMPCYQRDVIYHIICLSEEPGDKFRVLQKSMVDPEPFFSCMKFVRINANVVQLFLAQSSNLNEDRLCYDHSLERDPWPWTAPYQIEWSRCPFQGGYDFVQYLNYKIKVCQDIWRPSRMEMDCIYAEGMDFIFPDKHCNTFGNGNQSLHVKLQCWANWDEGDFTFLLLGHEKTPPQYIIRFPQAMDMYSEMTAYLYFSPASPLTALGQPPDDVHFVEMRMTRSEPGICFDESEKCREFAQQGKCTNSALHEYANFCRRSCGLCDYVPSPRPECRFPQEYLGEWMQFGDNNKVSVTIATGEITFSHLGYFICKTKHWSKNTYKLMSIFTNGCRPRFTCIDFKDKKSVILQYKISSSKHSDESFQMCDFRDDPMPLGSRIRSKDMKMLLATSHLHWGSCGLSGQTQVNASLAEGYSCQGVLTDWNPKSCNSRSKLILALDSCTIHKRQDHVCIAHLTVDESNSLLITQDMGNTNRFKCWAIETYPQRLYYKSWKKAELMTSSQCGYGLHKETPHQLLLHTMSSQVTQPCMKYNDKLMDIYNMESPKNEGGLKVAQKKLGLENSIKPRGWKSHAPVRSASFVIIIVTLVLPR